MNKKTITKTKSTIDKKKSKLDIPGLDLNDPLDMMGQLNNFLNNEPYSETYHELSKFWSKLPLYENKEQMYNFFESLVNNQVTLVISGTGSGKTVLIPKFLLKYFMITNPTEQSANYNGKIVITNPKILSTVENADYSAKTLDVPLGSYVGYNFRGSSTDKISKDTKLLYSTDGILLTAILKGDLLLSEYQGVIIDEAHERKLPIDLLLYFLKNVVINRPEFKVIIMSATIDAELFRHFYEKDDIKFGKVEISGQSNYPIKSIYLQPHEKINNFNFIDIGITKILQILDETDEGDILMFVASIADTAKGCSKLRAQCPQKIKITQKCNTFYCAELSAKTGDNEKTFATKKNDYKTIDPNYKRKIIFATNTAESSITVDGLVYVIDGGYEYSGYYDFIKCQNIISQHYITKAQVKQRMGRAGRTQPGTCYHLYTEQTYKSFDDYPKPDIITTNLCDQFLSFIKNQLYLSKSVNLAKNLITPATPDQITASIRFLHFNKLIKIIGNSKSKRSISFSSNQYSDSDSVSDSNQNLKNIFYNDEYFGGSESSVSETDYESDTNESSNIYAKREATELQKTEDALEGSLDYYNINYPDFKTYDAWNNYEGSITRFGKIINEMNGYPMELGLLAFYGKLLNLPSIYSLIGIIVAMDYKTDNLINFPPGMQFKDKIQFINQNFPDACSFVFSEHLFCYFLLTNYFEMGNKLELLNISVFDKVNESKKIFFKIVDRLHPNDLITIKDKYALLPAIDIDAMEIINKMYLAIFLAYRYHSIKQNSDNAFIYKTLNYPENSTATVNFSYGNQINSNDANNYSFGVCSNLNNFNNKVSMNLCTLFPNNFTNTYLQSFMK